MNNINMKNIINIGILCIGVILIVLLYIKYSMIKNTMNDNIQENNITNNVIEEKNNESKYSWEIKYIEKDKNSLLTTTLAKTYKWSKKSISEKYNSISFNNNEYASNKNVLGYEMIENSIEKNKAHAYDENNIEHISEIEIFKINDISEESAIAVQFENDDNYYVYFNLNYNPINLEKLMNDLNLMKIIEFETISYNYKHFNDVGKEKIDIIEFDDVNPKDIFDYIFDDLYVENLFNETNLHNEYIITINANIPVIKEGFKINLTEDGYLVTNILGIEKIFYVGKDKINDFVKFIIDNYKGYKIVYINEKEEVIEDNGKVLQITNTTKNN